MQEFAWSDDNFFQATTMFQEETPKRDYLHTKGQNLEIALSSSQIQVYNYCGQ